MLISVLSFLYSAGLSEERQGTFEEVLTLSGTEVSDMKSGSSASSNITSSPLIAFENPAAPPTTTTHTEGGNHGALSNKIIISSSASSSSAGLHDTPEEKVVCRVSCVVSFSFYLVIDRDFYQFLHSFLSVH